MNLPDNIKINGNIYLKNIPLKNIPKNSSIKKLFVEKSKIEEIPETFECQVLNLKNSHIRKVPKSVKIDSLHIDYAPFLSEIEDSFSISRDFSICGPTYNIFDFPKNMKIGRDFEINFQNSKMTLFP